MHRTIAGEAALGTVVAGYLLVNFCGFTQINGLSLPRSDCWLVVFCVKTGIEVVASLYALFYLLVALTYRVPKGASLLQNKSHTEIGGIAIGYLCCDDLDPDALESIARFCGCKEVPILVHDDSSELASRKQVDRVVLALSQKYGRTITVIRRNQRIGGKPQAVNNLVAYLTDDIEYLLLCDSDSYFYHTDILEQGLSCFNEPSVALVQFRNIGHVDSHDSAIMQTLSESITFFDAFVSFLDRFGWSPFLGHNAILSVSTLRRLGGLTPGQLADDIDYSVRLRLHGYTIRYARHLIGGERHPDNYQSLRRRTRKWTYGCTQILLRWGWKVLTCPHRLIGLSEKLTFFLTVSYYHFQVLLLAYLCLFYLVLPFEDYGVGNTGQLLISAGLILILTFVPSISFFIRTKRLNMWPRVALLWGLTYGSQDFVMLGAISQCVTGAELAWVPTNLPHECRRSLQYLPELFFGLLILAVPAVRHPALLLLPTTVIFAGKFLFALILHGNFRVHHKN